MSALSCDDVDRDSEGFLVHRRDHAFIAFQPGPDATTAAIECLSCQARLSFEASIRLAAAMRIIPGPDETQPVLVRLQGQSFVERDDA